MIDFNLRFITKTPKNIITENSDEVAVRLKKFK